MRILGGLGQDVTDYFTNLGVSYTYGGQFNITRSGTQSPTNQLAKGWEFVFNEEDNTATRGVQVFRSTIEYTGDGTGSLYGLANFSSFTNLSAGTDDKVGGVTGSSNQIAMRVPVGEHFQGSNMIALTTNVGGSGAFQGTVTFDNIFGLSMGGSWLSNGNGIINATNFAHFSANEFNLQPTEIGASAAVNWTNATNVRVERMLHGTNRSAFNIAASGTYGGAGMVFGAQQNASLVCGDGGDFVLDPTLQTNAVATIAINNAGTGYLVHGIHTIDGGGGGSTARVQITSVSGGAVTGVELIDIGKDYSDTTGAATSKETSLMGGNNDLTLDITVNPSPALRVNSFIKTTAGDASTPAFTFTADPDTGMFRAGANELGFSAGGTETLELDGTSATFYSDKLTIESDGDTYWTGDGTGLPYAEIYAYDVNNTITISGTGIANKVQVTSFNANGLSNNCTPDHTNDHITIVKAGVYKINVAISAASTGGTAYKVGFGVYKNNGATLFQNCHVHRNLGGGGGDFGSLNITGLIDLAANDTIELWAWNETNTNDVIIDDVTLNLIQIGGT